MKNWTRLFQTVSEREVDHSIVPASVPFAGKFVFRVRRHLKKGTLVSAVCGSLAVLYLLSTRANPPSLPVIPKLEIRQSPDTSGVPKDLNQSGSWRPEDAFPMLTFNEPIRLNYIPRSNQLCVFERAGLIVRFENDPATSEKAVFLDLRRKTLHDNRGPASLAFHPDFAVADSPHRNDVFVFYKRIDGYDVLSRFTATPEQTLDPESEFVLIEQHSSKTHAGGALAFGLDGFLYVSSGEERATDQTIDQSLHGGVFRIDVNRIGGDVSHPPPRQPINGRTQNYYIPNDNPFVGHPNALEEFWALGLRNPFTMTADSVSGEIWIGDVGRNTWEEVNRLARGANYEWSYREGRAKSERMSKPSLSEYVGTPASPYYCYLQSESNNSIIGGHVYRGKSHPDLYGRYIFGDNGSSRIWSITTDLQAEPIVDLLCQLPYYRFEGVSNFGTDAEGELYVCVLGRARFGRPGKILKLVPNDSASPASSDSATAQQPMASVGPAGSAVAETSGNKSVPIRTASFERNGRSPEPESISGKLSDTGVFTDLETLEPAPGVIAYTINTPFWSDNAFKKRWIVVPGDGTSDDSEVDRIVVAADFPYGLSFPVGTVFIKHFELPVDDSDPNVTLRLETRLTVLKANEGFCGMTYRWNAEQTEAFLIDERETADISIRTRSGRTRTQHWTFPSRADCRMCHNAATGYVLGVNVPQLNCSVTDPEDGEVFSQLAMWNRRGLLSATADIPSSVSEFEMSSWPQMAAVNDETASLEHRVRSYLAANCSQCHRRDIPGRPPRPAFDLRYHVPLDDRGLVGKETVVVPGSPSKSRLFSRLATLDHQRMPPIGRATVDVQAVAVFRRWINSLD